MTFLCRWDENGKFQAYHFKTLMQVKRDGVLLAVTENIMNIKQAIAAGFPLEAIMSQVHADALRTLDDVKAELAETKLLLVVVKKDRVH